MPRTRLVYTKSTSRTFRASAQGQVAHQLEGEVLCSIAAARVVDSAQETAKPPRIAVYSTWQEKPSTQKQSLPARLQQNGRTMTRLTNMQMTMEDLCGYTVSELECKQCGGTFCGARVGRLLEDKPLIMCGRKACVKEALSHEHKTCG